MAIHKIDPTKTARADRYDFRDRVFSPRLTNLPPVWPSSELMKDQIEDYRVNDLVRDQGGEGACTGFGLAAVIYCLAWRQWQVEGKVGPRPDLPSPLMLYDLARVYDEWEGEEGSGSSCRGAMKGWHKHGVCENGIWPRDPGRDAASPDWTINAIDRPLGAYYRVEARSIVDMQYAVHEIGALYCSAKVHSGWTPPADAKTSGYGGLELPLIADTGDRTGGHAFAVLGYTSEGFIIQNSSGTGWGKHGFAVLPYRDWVRNGYDAWVAALAAPIPALDGVSAPTSSSGDALISTAISRATGLNGSSPGAGTGRTRWSLDKAYDHSLVMGNNGRLLRRRVDVEDAEGALDHLIDKVVAKSVTEGKTRIAVIVHSGLLDEKQTMARVRALGPWIEANGICPIFVVWRTSLADALQSIARDVVPKFRNQKDRIAGAVGKSLVGTARKKLQRQFDKAYEAHAEKALGKATWSQIKQNAKAATRGSGAARLLLTRLQGLTEANPGTELHFVSHSAGAVLLTKMLRDLRPDDPVRTVSMYAPACTVAEAHKAFEHLFSKGILPKNKLRIDVLSEVLERADSVGAYSDSFLYLVSRALEEQRKTPLLGLARAWWMDRSGADIQSPVDAEAMKEQLSWTFDEGSIGDVLAWNEFAHANDVQIKIHNEPEVVVTDLSNLRTTMPRNHRTFDNDIYIVRATIGLINAGEFGEKAAVVDDLREFDDTA